MSPSRVFYGWWVTLAFSVMVFVSAGVRHAVGPFLKPMVADLGVDRGAFSLVIALGLLLYGAFMPWIGSLTDRFGARMVTAAGSVLLAAALALTSLCHNLWQLALVYGLLASLGLACTGPVVANAVVTRWFVRRRGTAVSLLGSAAMTGMSLLVPVVAWLIVTYGWRATYVMMGAAVLLGMLPLCLFVVRETPEAMGLGPDGDPAVAGAAAAAAATRTPAGSAVRTVAFWQLGGSFFTCGFSMALVAAHGVPMLTDHGYTPIFASWVIGVIANQVWSIAGNDDRPNTSAFFTQYFINYNLPDAWYLTSAPIITADWQASPGNKWTVPVGGGFGKVFRIGKLPFNANCGYYANVVRPDPGADWTLRLQIALLLPKSIFQ